MTEVLNGSCHCGVVQLRIAAPLPDNLNDCQCEHCQKRGALWAYYDASQISVTGATSHYVWGDRDLTFHFCPSCGMTTHWSAIDTTYKRMGVNARVLGRDVFQQIPIRKSMP